MAVRLNTTQHRYSRRGRHSPMSEINVTPLVDVMLVLLIVFMVTAPLLTAGVDVDLPRSDAPPLTQPQEPLVVSIDKTGKIFIQETDEKGNNIALSAQTGELTNDPKNFSLTLILRDGVRVDSKPDGTGGKASTFGESKLPLEVVAPDRFRENRKESELSLPQLVWAHFEEWPGLGRDDVLSEINYRIVRILTVLFLPFLAIPMGLTSRRQPTSIRIIVGIAILIIYYQALQFGKDMVENGRLSSFVALWVPFLVFALGSMYLFYVANSRFNQDPFAVVFSAIDESWKWLRARWPILFGRRRPA